MAESSPASGSESQPPSLPQDETIADSEALAGEVATRDSRTARRLQNLHVYFHARLRQPRLRWIFSLRTLLSGMVLLACGLAAWNTLLRPFRTEWQVRRAIREAGGRYELQAAGAGLGNWFVGGDFFSHIVSVELRETSGDEAQSQDLAEQLLRLPSLKKLEISNHFLQWHHLPKLRRARPDLRVAYRQKLQASQAIASSDPQALFLLDQGVVERIELSKGPDRQFLSSDPPARLLAAQPDGEQIVIAGRQRIEFFGHQAWERSNLLELPDLDLADVQFISQDRLLLRDHRDQLSIWNDRVSYLSRLDARVAPGSSGFQFADATPDGQFLALCEHDQGLSIWDLKREQRIRVLSGDQKDGAVGPLASSGTEASQSTSEAPLKPLALRFSADGKRLAVIRSGREEQVEFWDWRNGRRIKACTITQDQPWGLAFSTDGRWLAVSGSRSLVTIEVAPCRIVAQIPLSPGLPRMEPGYHRLQFLQGDFAGILVSRLEGGTDLVSLEAMFAQPEDVPRPPGRR